jgi:hypothetical protein
MANGRYSLIVTRILRGVNSFLMAVNRPKTRSTGALYNIRDAPCDSLPLQ